MFLLTAKDKYRQCHLRKTCNTRKEAMKLVVDNGYDKGNGEYSIKNLDIDEIVPLWSPIEARQ